MNRKGLVSVKISDTLPFLEQHPYFTNASLFMGKISKTRTLDHVLGTLFLMLFSHYSR